MRKVDGYALETILPNASISGACDSAQSMSDSRGMLSYLLLLKRPTGLNRMENSRSFTVVDMALTTHPESRIALTRVKLPLCQRCIFAQHLGPTQTLPIDLNSTQP